MDPGVIRRVRGRGKTLISRSEARWALNRPLSSRHGGGVDPRLDLDEYDRLVMSKRLSLDPVTSALASAPQRVDELPPARRFAEEFGVVGERIGMPRMTSRLLGYMLICDPPTQSIADLEDALGVSRASISIATRLLQASGLIRRAAAPGSRGYRFEIDPAFFAGQMNPASPFGMLRQALDRGVEMAGGEGDPRSARLREARDFYAFVERAVPEVIERYRADRIQAREAPSR
jgi:hypothetical protein